MQRTWLLAKAEIAGRLARKPWLKLVDRDHGDVYDVGRRIREIDDTLFIVWNCLRRRYEVHCLEHRPSTFAWEVPWPILDARTLEKAQENRVGRISVSQWLREMDENNERVDRSNERDFENYTQSFAREHRRLFQKAADNLAKGVI